MHVHRPPVDLGIADMYAAQAARKAAEAKRAADVRRKLLRASASIDGESSSFVSFISGERSGGGSHNGAQQDPTEDGPRQAFLADSSSPATPRTAAEPDPNPLSIWA